jgi:hypothetical protein
MTTTGLTFATGTLTVPHIFTAGSPALASDVNENFQALATAISNATASPFDKTTDDFTVVPVSVSNGQAVTIGGTPYTISQTIGISFQQGNAAQYQVEYPILCSTTPCHDDTSMNTSAINWSSELSKKTTVGGFPAMLVISLNSSSGFVGGGCSTTIRLDDGTYFHVPEGNVPGTYSNPLNKTDQQTIISHCESLLNYISITQS